MTASASVIVTRVFPLAECAMMILLGVPENVIGVLMVNAKTLILIAVTVKLV
jgi:hypothetical protein